MQRDHNILTETREIIVPLQPHEVKAGLNNSPGYRHHVFQCSGRSLWGLHPVSLRHLAMLGSDERAELLIQCEDIELHWDPVVPLEEKWRYRKTRESLKKHFGLQVGKPQKSVSDGKLPDISASHDRRDTLHHPEHDDTSSPKHNHQTGSFFDQQALERDRLLNLIAPRNTTHEDLAKNSLKTASEEELLRAAESFKTSADTIGKKLDFLPAVLEGKFSANPYEPRPQADKATASADRLGGLAGTPPLKVTPEASRGTQVQEQRARMIEAKKSNSKSTTSVVHDDNSVADTSFSDFQRAVAAAAKDNPLITNWNLEPPPPKTPASTGTREVSVNAPAINTDGEATIDTGPNVDDDAGTVESLEFLSDSEGGHSSHDSVEIESFLEVIDPINQENDNDHEELLDSKIKLPHAGGPGLGMLLQAGEGDTHQSTPNIEADAPLFPESIAAPTQCSASDDCHDADEERLTEDQIEVTSAIVASDTGSLERMAPASSQTTHPSVSKGTQTPKALALIMPTFPLSTASQGSHEVMSSYAAQVLRKPSHRSVQNAPTSDRSIGTAPIAEPALDQEPTASLFKNGKIGHDATEETPMDATARSRRKSKHALADHNGNYPALSHDEHTVHATSISEHLYLPPPHNFDAQPARHTSPKGSSYGRLDDPVFEAVVFPRNNGPELDTPLSLAFSDGNVDDWAQDLVAAFHDHAISHASGDQHERPAFPVVDASSVVEAAEVTSEETNAFQSKRNESSPREQAISLVQVPGAVDGGEVTTPHIHHVEAPDDKPLKAHSSQEDIHGNASSAGYDETTNQPLPIDTPAVNDHTVTPTEWAELVHLASHRPPESGNLLDSLLFYDDSLESNGIYPLHVPHPPPKPHHQSHISSYIWAAWEHGTYYFAAYIFVGAINPHMRAHRDLYLMVGVVLSGAWVVLKCLQSRSTQTRGGVSSLKQVNKNGGVQRWVKMCGTMSGVAVVVAALVFGLWPVENAGMGTTTTFTTTNTHTRKNAAVLTALHDQSSKPITTSDIDTPISTTPEEPTTTSIPIWPLVMTDECNPARGCCPEHGTESKDGSSAIPQHDSKPTTEDAPDSERNYFSSTTDEPQITPDSYGTSNSVVRVDPLQLSGPMAAVLISVPLGYLVKYSIWLWEMRDLTARLH